MKYWFKRVNWSNVSIAEYLKNDQPFVFIFCTFLKHLVFCNVYIDQLVDLQMQTNLLGSQKKQDLLPPTIEKRFILNTSIWPGQKDTLFDVWNCSLKRFWSAIVFAVHMCTITIYFTSSEWFFHWVIIVWKPIIFKR